MFPLRDSHPTYKFPLITICLIVINSLVFLIEISIADMEVFIEKYALIPSLVEINNITTWTPFITSQFLHAGFLHIISNMWFLRIFGDNVEERYGSLKFLVVYLLSGIVGGLLQYITNPGSDIPMLGASGSVAGVLGSYLVFFPHHKVRTLVPFGFYWTTANLSAYFMLVYWFVIQLFSGVGSLAVSQTGGVAFWAHVGGFATGFVITKLFQVFDKEKAKEGEIVDFNFMDFN